MSFELEQLREAAEKYSYHDAGTHGIWPRLVWERRSRSPLAMLDDAVDFQGKWKALRFKGGKTAFRMRQSSLKPLVYPRLLFLAFLM
jgi:hypothetical protein